MEGKKIIQNVSVSPVFWRDANELACASLMSSWAPFYIIIYVPAIRRPGQASGTKNKKKRVGAMEGKKDINLSWGLFHSFRWTAVEWVQTQSPLIPFSKNVMTDNLVWTLCCPASFLCSRSHIRFPRRLGVGSLLLWTDMLTLLFNVLSFFSSFSECG